MKQLIVFLMIIMTMSACSQKSDEPIVLIKTDIGNLRIKLYNETPVHRDNFIELAENGTLDSTLFHRVIKDFMIQGGDPESKNAEPGAPLGSGGPGYTIPAEIHFPLYFHKKGALAAARQADQVNPEKRSSGSQFYIVQGKVFDENELKKIEGQQNQMLQRNIFNTLLQEYNDSLNTLQQQGDEEKLVQLQQHIMQVVNMRFSQQPKFTYGSYAKEVYTTKGGTPFLDGNYTVFGEVVEEKTIFEKVGSLFGKKYGLEVVDAIANQETDSRDRPLKDIRIRVKVLK
jgi:cyclophilin family peptidyl-prolyl cis-trans isomerase